MFCWSDLHRGVPARHIHCRVKPTNSVQDQGDAVRLCSTPCAQLPGSPSCFGERSRSRLSPPEQPPVQRSHLQHWLTQRFNQTLSEYYLFGFCFLAHHLSQLLVRGTHLCCGTTLRTALSDNRLVAGFLYDESCGMVMRCKI
jgi:hypothetical protein